MGTPRDPYRGNDVHRAMRSLVLEDGLAALSLRAIADRCRIAPSTLVAQFTNRARLVHRFSVGVRFDLQRSLDSAAARQGVPGLLPGTQTSRDDLRLWHGVCELGHDDDAIAAVVAGRRGDEIAAITILLRRERDGELPTTDEVELVLAMLDGLRHAMVRRLAPMSRERAEGLLSRVRSAS